VRKAPTAKLAQKLDQLQPLLFFMAVFPQCHTGMHGPTCMFWAILTAFSPQFFYNCQAPQSDAWPRAWACTCVYVAWALAALGGAGGVLAAGELWLRDWNPL
jgi:hypothetical protein